MDNTNQNQNTQVVPESSQPAVSQQGTSTENSNVPSSQLVETQTQPQQTTPPPVPPKPTNNLIEKFKSSSKNVKLLVIVGIVFIFSIILLLVATIAKNAGMGKGQVVAPVATPTAPPSSPLPEVEISNPSRYATDSGVLKIESDVDALSKEMDGVDLRQSTLRVPTLDFNVKFQ